MRSLGLKIPLRLRVCGRNATGAVGGLANGVGVAEPSEVDSREVGPVERAGEAEPGDTESGEVDPVEWVSGDDDAGDDSLGEAIDDASGTDGVDEAGPGEAA